MTFDIRISGTEVHFACEPGQNLLDAALKAGIEMPYSCRKGVCGNCAGGVCESWLWIISTSASDPARTLTANLSSMNVSCLPAAGS